MPTTVQLEFTFDQAGDTAAQRPAAGQTPAPPAGPQPPSAPGLRGHRPDTPPPPQGGHPQPYAVEPPSLPANTRWRLIHAQDTAIGFVLRRSRRRSIGLSIGDDGLMVTAPHWVTLAQIDEAVSEKARWVIRKLAERQQRKVQTATADTAWRHEGTIPYFGVRIRLILGEHAERTHFTGDPFTPSEGDRLLIALPMHADHSRVRDAAHAWLQHQARAWFGLRLEHFLLKGRLSLNRWRLSSAATRWGSCSSDGNIMLNWRLIHFDHDIIDYVVAHEVAHLRELNHGNDFWREVGLLLPGFEASRNALKNHAPDTLPLL